MSTVTFAALPTPVGQVLVAVTDLGVAATSFGDSPTIRARLTTRLGLPVANDPTRTQTALTELSEYFAGSRHDFTVDLDWRLTSPTRQQVLHTLYTTVPYGQTITYGELARRSRTTIPPRGIGSIMGSNPIPIIIPCHRVVATDNLGGFSAPQGLESKRHLLTLEGTLPPTLW
jgi:methylated-DNA-[protein]-cysteine S-methyltransferase